MDFKDYPIYFLLAGLFLIAMLSFGVQMAENYGYDETLVKTSSIDFTRVENQITQTSNDAQSWGEAFRSDNPFVGFGSLVLFSIWGIGKLIWTSVIVLFTILTDGATAVFGLPAIVTGVLLAILTISLLFALWRMIKIGY